MALTKSKTLDSWFNWLKSSVALLVGGATLVYLVPILFKGSNPWFQVFGWYLILMGTLCFLCFATMGPKRLVTYRIELLLRKKTENATTILTFTSPTGTNLQLEPPNKTNQLYTLTESTHSGKLIGILLYSIQPPIYGSVSQGSLVQENNRIPHTTNEYQRLLMRLHQLFETPTA